jgi:hypothetical protein
VSGVLAAIAGFLVEPVSSVEPNESPPGVQPDRAWTGAGRPAVAVAGLAPRCGTTTVARALAAELALRDPGGVAVASTDAIAGGGIPLGTATAGRLARALSRALPVDTRPAGRICLSASGAPDAAALVDFARDLAPLVLDVSDPSGTASVASLVDAVVLVGAPDVEPALATVLSDSLRRVGPEPIVVLNRDRDRDGAGHWPGRCALTLPDSRLGAHLALAGREPRGDLGRAIAQLADLVTDV